MNATITYDQSALAAALYPAAMAEARRANEGGADDRTAEDDASSVSVTAGNEEDDGAVLNSEVRDVITNRINSDAAAPV